MDNYFDKNDFRDYYTEKFEEIHNLIEDSSCIGNEESLTDSSNQVSADIQQSILEKLIPFFEISKIPINENVLEVFYQDLFKFLNYLDDSLILSFNEIPKEIKIHMLLLKYFKKDYLDSKLNGISDFDSFKSHLDDSVDFQSIKNLYDLIQDNLTINIDIYEINENFLYISGVLKSFFNENLNIAGNINQEMFSTDKKHYPQRSIYSLNRSVVYHHDFEAYLNIDNYLKYDNDSPIKLSFSILDENNNVLKDNLNIIYNRASRLSKSSKYLISDKYLSEANENSISIFRKTISKNIELEIKTLISLISNRPRRWFILIFIRIFFFILSPFFKSKRIWIFMDRPDFADDNGLRLFEYAVNQDDEIKKYFTLKKGCANFSDIKKIGPVISYKSLKHLFYLLFADEVLSSHPDNHIVYPFWGIYPHLAGLYKFKLVFLQHGVIKHNISGWLKRYNMNMSLFVSSSKYERDSFFKYPYGFSEEIIQLTGLPRHDYLEHKEDYKEIVLMPTWRHNLKDISDEEFLKSNYFKIFNSLINNDRLKEICDEKGYRLIFKPHPNVKKFINLFDKEFVEFDFNRSYQDIFNHASLIITDYSSIDFDVAYLRKPLIYYQADTDFHFNINQSYFDYETMAFGEIVNNQDDLIDLIEDYLDNGCKMKDEYIKRVENFFAFNDKNNCKRVYDLAKKL